MNIAFHAPKRRRIVQRPEQVLHLAVAKYLDSALPQRAVWFHVPNSAKRSVIEAAYQKRMGRKPGVPDLLIFFAGRCCGIELKAPKGPNLTDNQVAMHEALRDAGVSTAVCRSINEVADVLDGFGIPLKARPQ